MNMTINVKKKKILFMEKERLLALVQIVQAEVAE